MAEKHFYRFPTVDFFGKSMPGVLFTLLSISLLPAQLITKGDFVTSLNLAVVVTALFVVIVVGFTVGQGLNTLTIVTQKSIYWVGLNVYRLLGFIGFPDYRFWTQLMTEAEDETPRSGQEAATDDETESGDDSVIRTGRAIAHNLYLRTKFWIWIRYLNFKTIFIPHRTAFENRLRRHMAEKKPEKYPNVELFENRYEAMTAELRGPAPPFPSPGETVEDITVSEDLYPLVSSYLTQQGITRSQRHKALYVFCRNTTNVLFLFAVAYAIMAIAPFFFESLLTPGPDTYIATLLSTEIKNTVDLQIHHLSVILLVTAVNFLYSTGEYKRYYIEYMIADFNHAAPKGPPIEERDRSD